MAELTIDGIKVGDNHPPYIIAEAGVNHESDYDIAYKMIVEAKKAGAHAIKFQTYEARDLVASDSPKYWKDDRPEETQLEFFERSSRWKRESAEKLAEMCREVGITFLSTGFDKKSIDLLDKLEMPAFKIASADITSYSLIRHIARKGKPIILSTGASTLGEIEQAVNVIKEEGNRDIIILHCVLSYPTPIEHSNLNMIRSIKKFFPEHIVGFSDHIIPDGRHVVPIVATALGSRVFEKHFTLDRSLKGNDHFHSVDPPMLKDLVETSRNAFYSLGQWKKEPLEIELPARKNARRSIAVNRDMKSGEQLSADNITLLRPGSGIHPRLEEELYGLRLKRDLKRGSLIHWEDLNS